MKQAVVAADRSLVVREHADPPLGAQDVLIEVSYCGLCGSDLHMVFDPEVPPVGRVLGHEFGGQVNAVGADVTSVGPGDLVAVLPIQPCGQCSACARPGNICLTGLMSGPGLGRPGGLADRVVVPETMAVRLPSGVDERAVAVAEPVAVAVRAVRRSGVQAAERVCVLGAGPIGLMTLAVLRAVGVDNIAVVELNEARRARAVDVVAGGHVTGDWQDVEKLLGGAPACVLDCTGHSAALTQAVALVDHGGSVVVAGIASEPSRIDTQVLAVKEVTLRGSLAYDSADFARAVELLAHGRIPIDQLVTGIVPLEQAGQLLAELHTGHSEHVKVLVAPVGRRG